MLDSPCSCWSLSLTATEFLWCSRQIRKGFGECSTEGATKAAAVATKSNLTKRKRRNKTTSDVFAQTIVVALCWRKGTQIVRIHRLCWCPPAINLISSVRPTSFRDRLRCSHCHQCETLMFDGSLFPRVKKKIWSHTREDLTCHFHPLRDLLCDDLLVTNYSQPF